jgi:uncharacterized protein
MIERTAETEFFWSELAAGRLLARRCTKCGETQAYPRRLCVRCGSEAAEWVALPVEATIYTFTEVAAPPPDRPYLTAPFTLAIVEFDGGHRMMGLVERATGAPLTIGQRVRFAPWRRAATVLPGFAPIGDVIRDKTGLPS